MSRWLQPAEPREVLGILILGLMLGATFVWHKHAQAEPSVVDLTVERLIDEEGYREHEYEDTAGNRTIGIGFNIEAGISRYAAKALARAQVEERRTDLLNRWPPFLDQPTDVQVALLDLAFELGVSGLLTFDTFLSLVESGQYDNAADDLLGTLYAKQVPSRAKSIADLIRGAE